MPPHHLRRDRSFATVRIGRHMPLDDRKDSAPADPPRAAGGRSALATGLLVVAALLPVALLSLFSYRLASKRLLELVRSSNAAAAAMTGELVRSDLARNIDMARAL